MKRTTAAAMMLTCALGFLSAAIHASAQCDPGWTKYTQFGQFWAYPSCVVEITFCQNNSDPTHMVILEWHWIGNTYTASDMCDAIRLTLAQWQYGACPGNPPKSLSQNLIVFGIRS